MKKITEDWLQSAESDLILIQRIIDQDTLTHQVAFHAQQAIEKCFKAIIEEYDLGFIKTHSLETLSSLVKKRIDLPLTVDMLILLDQLYLDARYPGEMGLLPNGRPSLPESREFAELAEAIHSKTKEILQ
ncbi:MAG: HEPN domain-containing protein [Bacteroidetes bacterium]|nr:HEPN domain-containing protein [Bacteroidota bacterium]